VNQSSFCNVLDAMNDDVSKNTAWKGTSEAPDAWRLTDGLHAPHGKGDPFAAAIRATRMPMIITDPRQEDNPIVFANEAFLRLTGYSREDVMGRNCRFLQGPQTSKEAVARVREAVRARHDINIDLLNYRKDGSTFWNALYMSPVTDESGELQYFFASQLDVSDRKETESKVIAEKERVEQAVEERTQELSDALDAQTALLHEVDHRVKNNLQMISSLIVMQLRTIPDPQIRASLTSMLERVEALSTVHRRLYQSDDVTRFDVADFVRDLVNDLVGAAQGEVKAGLSLQPVDLPAEQAAPLALIVNELVTNSLKHAFKHMDGDARLDVSLANENDRLTILISDNGGGIDGAPRDGSFGMKLIKALGRQLRADVTWNNADPGTTVRVDMPSPRTPTTGAFE
jgi:PAS domain S-box-containing protein